MPPQGWVLRCEACSGFMLPDMEETAPLTFLRPSILPYGQTRDTVAADHTFAHEEQKQPGTRRENLMRFILFAFSLAGLLAGPTPAQQPKPAIPSWCRNLPRPAYKKLERVPLPDAWFEVYKVAPGGFAIYDPHQWEEVISYRILGEKRALLFDTG